MRKHTMRLIPHTIQSLYLRAWVLPRVARSYRDLPAAETFRRIYASGTWGVDAQWGFSSGSGSRGIVAEQYCSWVVNFIRERAIRTVVDLGCGDFYIGNRIIQQTGTHYVGIDVVPELIEHHKSAFDRPNIAFHCLDITKDPLPGADLCLVRQVFQHLSNAQIAAALRNLERHPLALVSEHVPRLPRSFNRDKVHGPDIRCYYGSGVYLDQPPFSREICGSWEIPVDDLSVIRTVMIAA